jgi:hypothetical protein
VKVELHDAGGLLVASLFGEDPEKFLECSVTKLMLYITEVGKKYKEKKFMVAQNIFVTQFYIEYRYISNKINITV